MEVDKNLLMTQEQLQLLIDTLLEDSKYPEDILKAEPHPSVQTLVKFADLIYTRKIYKELDAVYGARILSGKVKDLTMEQEGWKILISANNTNSSNGYFGAAFVNTGLQQVVVAHRGTDPKCFGALYTDIRGIFLTKYTSCMNSATTFVDFIRQAIQSANLQHKHYTLAITGHSLGAWLAQITTFSVKYLAINVGSEICFKLKPEVGIHAKTVGFDSPGARGMLDKVQDSYYVRYGRNVLDGLDITLYLSAPNHINTSGVHLGKIYRVFNDKSEYDNMFSDLVYVEDGSINYTFATHGIKNFIKALIIDKSGKVGEVTDWAISNKEFNKLFEKLNWDNNYHVCAQLDNSNHIKKFLRYKVARPESPESVSITFNGSFRVFSEVELRILFKMHKLQGKKSELTILNEFIVKNKLNVESCKLLPKFDLDYCKQTITCGSGEALVELWKRLKQLMRWLETQFTQAVEKEIKIFNQSADRIYYKKGQSYLNSLSTCWLDFTGSDDFKKFLASDIEQFLCLFTSSKDVEFQMSRLRNILDQMKKSNDSSKSFIKYICKNHYTFVRQSQMQNLIENFGWPVQKEFLMVVDCTLSSDTSILQLLNDVYEKDIKSLKLVLIVSQPINTPDSSKFCKTLNFNDVHFSDLTPDSQNKMFNRGNVITIGGKEYSFERFLGEKRSDCKMNQLLSSENVKNFATIKNYSINIEDMRSTLSDIQMPFFKLNIKTFLGFFASCVKSVNTNILVVMSGLSREDLETGAGWDQLKGMDIILAEGDAQLFFRDTCNKNQDKCIYLFEVLGQDVYCKEVFNRHIYLDRKFLHRAYIDVKKFAETEHADDLFVINSQTNKELLVELIKNCRKKEAFTDNILIKPKKKEVNVIKKYINKRIHFVKIYQCEESHKLEWRYSHGSLESLLPFMSTDSFEPINELQLCKTGRNLTIIADEPGMGKTTTLSSLAKLVDSPWVIYIGLRHNQRHIENTLSDTLTHKSVAKFLLSFQNFCGSQADRLLEYILQSKINSKRVVLMLDGFDELDDNVKDEEKESAKQNIIKLLIYFKNIPTVKIFLTARKYLKRSLENELCNLCTPFVPLNKKEQQNFLVVIWRSCLSLELEDYGEEEEGQLKEYAGQVLRQAQKVLGPDMECIMGVLLQMRMLAEVFRPTSDLLLHSPEVLFRQINVESTTNLYKNFFSLKFKIYLTDKISLRATANELIKKQMIVEITNMYCELGFKTFFPHFYVKHFDAIEDRWLNDLCRVGLIQKKEDGDIQFVHRTYAEYYCAQMLVHQLNLRTLDYRYELLKEIIPQILLHPDSKIIRMFINGLFRETTMSETAFELNAICISQLWNEDSSIFRNQRNQTVLHIAVIEGNEYIAKLLLIGLKIESAQEVFVSLIKQYDNDNNTAINFLNKPTLHNINADELVLDTITTNILQCIKTCSDEAKVNIFFAILFNRKVSNFDETAEKFFFERLFNRHDIKASQVSTEEEHFIIIDLFYRIITKYLSCTSRIFNRVKEVELVITPFREAVENNNVKLLKKILLEKLENNVERYCLVLMKPKNQIMRTVLHLAVKWGHLDMVRVLMEQTAVPFAESMAQLDGEDMTSLHTDGWQGRLNIIKYLLERGAVGKASLFR